MMRGFFERGESSRGSEVKTCLLMNVSVEIRLLL